ncbi:MAG: 1-(5-phosphoribosyl)-5-[(5-phosphoribosylamino)methylideneamino]imidazole-4-carboxamide isomerase [Firmicutes bacterium]|jgi:phosphoribosylformimino-5-aminoimidazole carboxamide ribotide isomerase|nr:1-(5-phosphoribosyl)-5-[(5-phosphoribosylamino)methylideneamino]imidazole-4-carboxamide isomerase [Bacillota bacterium]
MIIIPAIDLRDGRCVRLERGDYSKETIYDQDPVAVARRWVEKGAKRLHLVDLDGAKAGTPVQKDLVIRIARSVPVPVEVGGGIRTEETIRYYLENGVKWVILGSAAVKNRELLFRAAQEYPGRVILGLDARDGKVAVEGWLETTSTDPLTLVETAASWGVHEVIYTDINRDGTLKGPNLEALAEIAGKSSIPVIASGGISSLGDLLEVKKLAPLGISGAIVGKALYSGAVDLEQAIACVETQAVE